MKLLCILQQGDLSVTDGSVLSHRLYFDFANRIGIDGKDGEDGTDGTDGFAGNRQGWKLVDRRPKYRSTGRRIPQLRIAGRLPETGE